VRHDVPPRNDGCETIMQALRFFLSPQGRLAPQPFVYGAVAVYLLGVASQLLTTADILHRAGLLPFVAVQLLLVWAWFSLHARRLHDAGRSSGLALGIALFYLVSVVLLLIVADGFFATSGTLLGDANAQGALWLLVLVYIFSVLGGASQYDLTWVVVVILLVMTFAPIILALGFSVWAARRPGFNEA
jgi:uncharacterized membrane protein YhaH (DUF805 family)